MTSCKRLKTFHDSLNYIEVRDTGHGMSFDELTDVFLRIGTHSRRNENLGGVRNLGDKGIGRLSAMRLGDYLGVKTSKSGEQYWNLLDIDWTLFSHDEDVDADDIAIEPEIGDEKAESGEHGTTIRISALSRRLGRRPFHRHSTGQGSTDGRPFRTRQRQSPDRREA